MEKQRIEFIDLAKGICIILVVMGHCGIDYNHIRMHHLQMPIFFLMSGIFFKTYGGFYNFILKKTTSLIVPFIAFTTIAIAMSQINIIISNILNHTYVFDSLFENFNLRNGFLTAGCLPNVPLWFLVALFWCNIIYYFIDSLLKKWYIKSIISIIIGATGCLVSLHGSYLPIYLGSAFTALPFFFIGYMLNKTKLLQSNKYDKVTTIISSLFLLFTIFIIAKRVKFTVLYFENDMNEANLAIHYLVLTLASIALLLVCKKIKRIPFISYVGKYSIIILCTHMIIKDYVLATSYKLGFMEYLYTIFGNYRLIIIFIITLTLSTLSIPLCLRFIPSLVAQKDLIKFNKK